MHRCYNCDELHLTAGDRDRCCVPVSGPKAVLYIGGITIFGILVVVALGYAGVTGFLGLLRSLP